jgi:hypothetical protein
MTGTPDLTKEPNETTGDIEFCHQDVVEKFDYDLL